MAKSLKQSVERFFKQTQKGEEKAAKHILRMVKQLLNVQNKEYVRLNRKGKQGRKAKGSPAGSPPYKQSGDGRESMGIQKTDGGWMVGGTDHGAERNPSLIYMKEHDAGTLPGGPRPFLLGGDYPQVYRTIYYAIVKREATGTF